jgi:hypothetical protein
MQEESCEQLKRTLPAVPITKLPDLASAAREEEEEEEVVEGRQREKQYAS